MKSYSSKIFITAAYQSVRWPSARLMSRAVYFKAISTSQFASERTALGTGMSMHRADACLGGAGAA